MSMAAVPAYLRQDFKEASPGLRFGMYLKLWGVNRRTQALLWETHDVGYEVRGQQREERKIEYENKVSALSDAKGLSKRDKDAMKALADRQFVSAQTAPAESLLRLEAIAQAPFTTGLGNEHPLENGFAFLNPYGLPYLPGSGVKGVLRQAARELASGDWGDKHGWGEEKTFSLHAGQERILLSSLDALFGLESKDGGKANVRGALTFWDVIPQIAGDSLMVEIMTPHQSHYYQEKRDRKAGDSTTPHDSGQPNPISFLTVPPGSGFIFHVVCDLVHLRRIAPELAENDQWKTLLTAAFAHAFNWLGFGAKTAVGYGAMETEEMRRARMGAREQAIPDRGAAPRRAPATIERTEMTWPAATLSYDPGRIEIKATFEGKSTAGVRGERVKEMLVGLGNRAEQLKKKKELKNVAVQVRMQGNLVELLGLAEQP